MCCGGVAVRKTSIVIVALILQLIAAHPVLAVTPTQAAAVEFLGGTLGGVVGVGLGVVAIGSITPNLESRAARIATVITGVTLGGGLGATAGVLAAGRLFGVQGNAQGCLLGALAGGLASAFVEPLLYLLGIPERTTEFLGFLLLPIAPAVGATIGFNWSVADPRWTEPRPGESASETSAALLRRSDAERPSEKLRNSRRGVLDDDFRFGQVRLEQVRVGMERDLSVLCRCVEDDAIGEREILRDHHAELVEEQRHTERADDLAAQRDRHA